MLLSCYLTIFFAQKLCCIGVFVAFFTGFAPVLHRIFRKNRKK